MPESFTIRGRRPPRPTNLRSTTYGASRFELDALDAAPAEPAALADFRYGDLSGVSVSELVAPATEGFGSQNRTQRGKRRRGTTKLLKYLYRFDGSTWQQRWNSSGLDSAGTSVTSLGSTKDEGYELSWGVQALFALRVIRPSLRAFRAQKFYDYANYFAACAADPALTKLFDACDDADTHPRFRHRAKYDIACALTTQGIQVSALTWQAFLYYSLETRKLENQAASVHRHRGHFVGLLAWDVMAASGHFPPGTPSSLRKALYTGQLSAEQLVDRYDIQNFGIRQLLIEYLIARQGDTDYTTRVNLAGALAGRFWSQIEELSPGHPDLNIPDALYEQWRETIRHRAGGERRMDLHSILLPVRAFYMDIQRWALEEPARWAVWAARCPIPQSDLRDFATRRRRIKERMDDRTRQLQPLLPRLVALAEERKEFFGGLLAAAAACELGESFVFRGKEYRRADSRTDRLNSRQRARTVRVVDDITGDVIDAVAEEDSAFWAWAYVEVLRQTGIRVEELVELSHTSIRQYPRSNGEVVALLVIAPSKSDRERVLPMSADLFHVIATIIRRQTANGSIPVIPRYDAAERAWTEPLPFLFQRQVGAVRRVVSTGSVNNALKSASQRLVAAMPAAERIHFTAHDFRRLFATDVVNNGLPIHIGAALLGHLNINTTRGYTAVFNDDIVRHYQAYLDRRRASRPNDEYRQVTDEEWLEFEEHFDKRKIELGSCGRPYGTPCSHEHSCIRCPMLHVDPKMIVTLDEIEEDLLSRRRRAQPEGWLGEIEGIELTLKFLAGKRAEAQRTQRAAMTDIGMPGVGPPDP